MPNNNKTLIVKILDRSGSMTSTGPKIVSGFNEFLDMQKREPGEGHVLLVRFDAHYEVVYDLPLKEARHITYGNGGDLDPRGFTALHDAIGITIRNVGERLSKMAEEDRPGKVIVVILTDGMENASKEFTRQAVADMVKHQREKYNWQFVFIGAEHDAIFSASTMDIPVACSLNVAATDAAIRNTYANLSNKVSFTRGMSHTDFLANAATVMAWTDKDRQDALVEDEKS